jgi:5-deoxy-glucuronate isomerase
MPATRQPIPTPGAAPGDPKWVLQLKDVLRRLARAVADCAYAPDGVTIIARGRSLTALPQNVLHPWKLWVKPYGGGWKYAISDLLPGTTGAVAGRLYLPNGSDWAAEATTPCTLAVCSAPGQGGHAPRRIGPGGIVLTPRGQGANTRHINNIAMEAQDWCDSLLVTEVFTPAGNWSSYPPHRHDEDDCPRMTYLEETYYHRLNPAQGYGLQRVYTEDGTLDETMTVKNHDVVLVPKGHHPCAAPYGYEMYYLNVMAGPVRKWRFQNDPDHDWIWRRDNPA